MSSGSRQICHVAIKLATCTQVMVNFRQYGIFKFEEGIIFTWMELKTILLEMFAYFV